MFIKDFYSTNILKVVHQAKRYTNGGIGGDNEDVSKWEIVKYQLWYLITLHSGNNEWY